MKNDDWFEVILNMPIISITRKTYKEGDNYKLKVLKLKYTPDKKEDELESQNYEEWKEEE